MQQAELVKKDAHNSRWIHHQRSKPINRRLIDKPQSCLRIAVSQNPLYSVLLSLLYKCRPPLQLQRLLSDLETCKTSFGLHDTGHRRDDPEENSQEENYHGGPQRV